MARKTTTNFFAGDAMKGDSYGAKKRSGVDKVFARASSGKLLVDRVNLPGRVRTIAGAAADTEVPPAAPELGDRQPNRSFADLPVLEADYTWSGDPRDMTDEDIAFFDLER